MLPATALAAEGPVAYWAATKDAADRIQLDGISDVQSYAQKGGYICLNRALIVPCPVRIDANMALDLNGRVIARQDGWGEDVLIKANGEYKSRNSGEVILVPKGKMLTIVDNKPGEPHNGKLVSPDRKADNGSRLWRPGNGTYPISGAFCRH